ncbi:MAG TPA: aspartate--tRNA ligase [Candidatus Methylacidiphilales bacterium]|jgi:aspartyl-tRNA synthetase|nr:aspartate--tRNA ligase [Candidatus Methylacidiphilales bacterium]
MSNPYRTHTCNDLRASHAGQTVRLAGWIHNKRDLGGVLFIDLRDHYGITQIVIPPTAGFQDALSHLPKETVISVHGNVRLRPEGTVNPNIPTGDVELDVAGYEKLGGCEPLPMNVFPEDHTPEETRLKYRFLDLRRSKLHKTVMLRAKVISSIRRRMIELGFQEFQTPILTSSSPEGARDFLVPSRLYPGEFYALPQAPQQFKQLLMVSGFDRYFQIAPCFRDEDGRADRTPGEFYQLDVEMSFVTQDDVFAAMEKLFVPLFAEFKPEWKTNELSPDAEGHIAFQRLTYKETLLKYGTDKPDLRIPFEIRDLTPLFAKSEFKAFAGKTVRAFAVPQAFDQPRSWFDNLQEEAKKLGAPGLAYVKVSQKEEARNAAGEIAGTTQNVELSGPIAKFMHWPDIRDTIIDSLGNKNSVIFFSADANEAKAAKILGAMRVKIAEQLDLIEKEVFKFTWIVDYPMYEKNEETGDIEFSHNPFSMPQGGLEALEKQDPLTIFAYQYDLVCNGYEIASGAIRNHSAETMYKAFALAGHPKEVVDTEFAGMINAFRYGAPPHGGIAPGIDRIVMLLANESSIREVIAFPMAQNGRDLLMNAPAPVSERQLRDVHISIRKPVPKV